MHWQEQEQEQAQELGHNQASTASTIYYPSTKKTCICIQSTIKSNGESISIYPDKPILCHDSVGMFFIKQKDVHYISIKCSGASHYQLTTQLRKGDTTHRRPSECTFSMGSEGDAGKSIFHAGESIALLPEGKATFTVEMHGSTWEYLDINESSSKAEERGKEIEA